MIKPTTGVFLLAFGTMAGIHALAIFFYLYWYYKWLDIPMHFLGGSVAALGWFTLRDLRIWPMAHMSVTFISTISFVVGIMLVWEWFEWYFVGIAIFDLLWSDTVYDLIVGFVGGVVGYNVGKSLDTIASWQQP